MGVCLYFSQISVKQDELASCRMICVYFVTVVSIKHLFKVFCVLYKLANWRECCAAGPALSVDSTWNTKLQGWEHACSKTEMVFEEELQKPVLEASEAACLCLDGEWVKCS